MTPNKNNKNGSRRKKRTGPTQKSGSLIPWKDTLLTDSLHLPSSASNTFRSYHTLVVASWLTQSAAVVQNAAYAFVANASITDWTSWAACFDQYRVLGVEIYLEPQTSEALISATVPAGKLYTVLDYDDSNALTTPQSALAYDNCIATTVYQRQRRCFKPRIALAAYGGGAFTSYANETAPWIDAASATVNHFGLKAICDIGNAGVLQTWNLVARSLVEFRAAR